MKITRKKSKWGNVIIVIGCVIFIIYWIILLVPVQRSFVERNLETGVFRQPSLVLFSFIGLIVGALFGAITSVGFNIGKVKDFGGIPMDLNLDDIVESKSFWLWVGLASLLTLIFTIAWRAGI